MKKSRRIVKGYFSQSAEIWEHYDTVELHHFLPASHIQLGVECQDWKEIVENMGRWMYEHGYVEKRYDLVSKIIRGIFFHQLELGAFVLNKC